MQISIKEINNCKYAVIESDGLIINDIQDSLDIMANCSYMGASGMVLKDESINSDFFKLSTGFAGEVLQKYSNYKFSLIIIGDFSKYSSKSLRDFIYESNKLKKILFVDSLEMAEELLS